MYLKCKVLTGDKEANDNYERLGIKTEESYGWEPGGFFVDSVVGVYRNFVSDKNIECLTVLLQGNHYLVVDLTIEKFEAALEEIALDELGTNFDIKEE